MCMDTSFFRFVTMHAFDRQTKPETGLRNTVRCITCDRTVKTDSCPISLLKIALCKFLIIERTFVMFVHVVNKMLSYRRVTALQGELSFSPEVED